MARIAPLISLFKARYFRVYFVTLEERKIHFLIFTSVILETKYEL